MALLALIMPLLFVGIPTALYFRSREEARRRWLPRQEGTTHVGDQNYRGAEVPRMVANGPPALVHATAVLCWIFGVAFLPGLAATLIGLLAAGIGVVGIPGLIASARLFRLGGPLLRGEPEAAKTAREVSRYVRWLNYVVLAISSVFGAAGVWEFFSRGRLSGDTGGMLVMVGGTVFYAVMSLIHAKLLEWSAAEIESDQARRAALRGEENAVALRVAPDEVAWREEGTGVRLAPEETPDSTVEAHEVMAAEADVRREGR